MRECFSSRRQAVGDEGGLVDSLLFTMKSHAPVRRGNKTIPTAPTRPREEAMHPTIARVIGAALFAFVSCLAPARAEPPRLPVPTVDQSAVAQRGYFYVGGKYVGKPGKIDRDVSTSWRPILRETE